MSCISSHSLVVFCLVNQNAKIRERKEEVKGSSDPKCENAGAVEALR
jgi:hypothetical protein